jgi:hypothetical protein
VLCLLCVSYPPPTMFLRPRILTFCPSLTFTSGPVAGKTMVVQTTNTGGDLGSNHFDIQMPGGGVGLFDGCTPQFGGIPGERYGGVSSRSQCDQMH